MGVFTFTLLQLSIESSAAREVHPLNGCKKVTRSIYPCLHLPRSVLGFGFRSAGKKFVFYSESQQAQAQAKEAEEQAKEAEAKEQAG